VILATGQEQQAGKLLSKAIYQEEVNGELDEAIKTYRLIVQQYPDNRQVSAEALLHLGICYEKIGMPQAYDTYQDIIDKYAEQLDEVAMAQQRLDRLIAYADDVSKKAEQHMNRGNELLKVWEYESAIKEYERVIELRPNTLFAQNALYNIGQSWFKKGHHNNALATFKKLLTEYPGSPIIPVTELMVERVRTAKKENEKLKLANNSSDKGHIIDPKTGVEFTKLHSYSGKNDLISYTSGGFTLSPDNRFMVLENQVVPIDGSDAFKLVDMNATRSVYSPDMKKVAFYADEAIWVARVFTATGHTTGTPERLLDGRYRYQHPVSWSPDGEKLLILKIEQEYPLGIWILSISDGTLTKIAENGFSPVWSPKGDVIAYFKNREVWLSPVSGGNPWKIIDLAGRTLAWSPNGKWLHHYNWEINQLFCLADSSKIDLRYPKEVGRFIGFSPDNKKMLFYHSSYDDKWGMKVVSPSGGPAFEPGPEIPVYDAQWSPDGKFFLSQGENEDGEITFWIIPFAGGEPVMLKIDAAVNGKPFPFEVSKDQKKLAFTISREDGNKDLYVIPISVADARSSGPAEMVFEGWTAGAYNVVFSWSPDGNDLAIIHEDEIWKVPLSGGESVQLTNNAEGVSWINWSPDGRLISYHINEEDKRNLYIIPSSGGNSTLVQAKCRTASWSPNSQELSVLLEDNISIVDLDGQIKRQIIELKELDLDDTSSPRWSSDGQHLAFIGYKRGVEKSCLFKIPAKGGTVTELVPEDNSFKYSMHWSPDGKWISYLTEEAVKVRPEGILWEADFEEVYEKLQAR
jgi:Tol biopolymer transport system component/tetratricopeptide (TPR) repeat protein